MEILKEKVEWKCALGKLGTQCVMISGEHWMLWWSADNLDTPLIVHTALFVMHIHPCSLFFCRCACILQCILRSRQWSHSVGQCPL